MILMSVTCLLNFLSNLLVFPRLLHEWMTLIIFDQRNLMLLQDSVLKATTAQKQVRIDSQALMSPASVGVYLLYKNQIGAFNRVDDYLIYIIWAAAYVRTDICRQSAGEKREVFINCKTIFSSLVSN